MTFFLFIRKDPLARIGSTDGVGKVTPIQGYDSRGKAGVIWDSELERKEGSVVMMDGVPQLPDCMPLAVRGLFLLLCCWCCWCCAAASAVMLLLVLLVLLVLVLLLQLPARLSPR